MHGVLVLGVETGPSLLWSGEPRMFSARPYTQFQKAFFLVTRQGERATTAEGAPTVTRAPRSAASPYGPLWAVGRDTGGGGWREEIPTYQLYLEMKEENFNNLKKSLIFCILCLSSQLPNPTLNTSKQYSKTKARIPRPTNIERVWVNPGVKRLVRSTLVR